MIKLTRLILLISLISMIYSCSQGVKKLKIDAKISGFSDSTKFKLSSLDMSTVLDSSYIYKNELKFELTLKSGHPEHLRLSFLDPELNEYGFTDLIVQNEDISFLADRKDFPYNIDFIGSKYQDEKEKFHQILYQRDQSISHFLNKNKDVGEEERRLQIRKLNDQSDTRTAELIKKYPNSYAALKAFKHYKERFSNVELIEIYNRLNDELRNTNEARAILQQSQYKKPEIGDHYYDYSAVNQHGVEIGISDFDGRYRLLNIASKFCYYSQKSWSELKDIHNKYDSKLTLISISNDKKREDWLDNSNKNDITWDYLWDGKADHNDLNSKYWKTGTPHFILISPEGTIIEDWFGYGKGTVTKRLEKHISN